VDLQPKQLLWPAKKEAFLRKSRQQIGHTHMPAANGCQHRQHAIFYLLMCNYKQFSCLLFIIAQRRKTGGEGKLSRGCVSAIVQALFQSIVFDATCGCNFNKRLAITIAGKLSQVQKWGAGLGPVGVAKGFSKMLAECVSPAHLPHSTTDKRYAICETSQQIVEKGAKNFMT